MCVYVHIYVWICVYMCMFIDDNGWLVFNAYLKITKKFDHKKKPH